MKKHEEPKPQLQPQPAVKGESEGDQGIAHHTHTSPHKGPVSDLLTQSAYSYNKKLPQWEYKPLYISHFHNLRQVVEGEPEEDMGQQPEVSGKPPAHAGNSASIGKYKGKQKIRHHKSGKKPHTLVKFRGI